MKHYKSFEVARKEGCMIIGETITIANIYNKRTFLEFMTRKPKMLTEFQVIE